ncbi:TPA: PilZ domain-containing protein, partial [Raoultella planticola]|nr:PilZ domain-containing protein [Raoultella planticola]
SILKNSVLSLAEHGEITIDLAIKNVVEVTFDEDSESYHQVSCQFKFRNREDKTRIEKMLLDLILEAKRKKRV